MKHKKLTLGQVEALINKIGGEQEVRDFLSGKFIFLKQEVEKKPQIFSKEKHLSFLGKWWREHPTIKGILFTSSEETKSLFYSLVEDTFTEISSDLFKRGKEVIPTITDSLLKTIIHKEIVTPTRIVQDIFFIMKKMEDKLSPYTTYKWYFIHEETKYTVRLSLLEEKGSFREIYTLNCGVEKPDSQ